MATEYNYQAARNRRQPSPDVRDFSEAETTHTYLDKDHDSDLALRKIRTAGSISISPELFEKLYLSPQIAVKGELRKTFGNPTPLALVGFLLSLTPLSCILMGWRGAGGSGGATVGSYFFFGGMLMTLGGIGEWIVGNTFPFVVFTSFGAFWLTYGATLDPYYGSGAAYPLGVTDPQYYATFAFFLVFMGVLCFLYLILALRTNIIFVGIFLTLVLAFGFLAGAFWNVALGKLALAGRMQVAGGACCFVTCMLGWWIFFAIMLAALDFPFQLPVGDLSTMIKGASERKAAHEEAADLTV